MAMRKVLQCEVLHGEGEVCAAAIYTRQRCPQLVNWYRPLGRVPVVMFHLGSQLWLNPKSHIVTSAPAGHECSKDGSCQREPAVIGQSCLNKKYSTVLT
jgi:hypothetical protein